MKKKAYIIHGYAATPSDHWFQYVKQVLENEGITALILEMPNPMHPKPESWQEYLRNNLSDLDAETTIIAHSLGVVTTLRYLLSLRPRVHIKGLLLVSGFYDALPNLPQLDAFTAEPLDTTEIRQLADHRIMFVSDNDQIVNPSLTTAFAHEIDAELHVIKNAGHFLADDGYKEFPEIVKTIRAIF